MGWLKRIAQVATGLATGVDIFAPMAKAVLPDAGDRIVDRLDDFSTRIATVVVNSEVVGNALALSGEDKLKAAVPAMTNVFLQSQALRGRKVKDEVKFRAAIEKITSGCADLFSSLEEDN